MMTLTAKAEGVPPWRQPVRTGTQIVAYAEKLGDIDTAVTWLQERHFRVPDRAIAQARQLAANPPLVSPDVKLFKAPLGGTR